ncbi:MAG TPA: phospholipase D family protein [Candidatus Binataceae bacterium]|nr:phospholipase D family protein [Candidatus Binataceae bacterium]
MRAKLGAASVFAALFSLCIAAGAAEVQVCFSPPIPGGCDPTATIVKIIDSARHQVLVQAYEFTSHPIAKAIADAHRRGLDVRVILDKNNLKETYSELGFLQHDGVPIMIDYALNIAHSKVMIVDGDTVITGSFNFTKAAETENGENLVVIRDPAVAAQYLTNWNSRMAQSAALGAPMNGRGGTASASTLAVGQVVGNRRSRIFAWPGCASYDRMSPENRVIFQSREAAEAAGFRAAKNCH